MIQVQLNKADFEYDIHSLVKAFYPQHDVLVKAAEREEFPKSLFHLTVIYREKELFPELERESVFFSFCGSKTLEGETEVDFSDRKETKNRLKQKLYELLSEFSGQTLPWGTLTGIRPTKIPMAMLEEGKTDEENSEKEAINDFVFDNFDFFDVVSNNKNC